VTFVASMLERVIEEQARGQAERASAIRGEIRQPSVTISSA
jgi:fumarylacetoacetate (FAA) hydrolase family protein